MLALFSPPVLLFDKCAFVCTLIQYISRFATCQANFSCKLRETQRKFQPATGYLYPSRWLRLSDDVATATTEMERSGIEVAVLGLMPESFRSCGDSHTSMQRQRNRSCGSRSYAWIFPFMWRQPRLRWSISGIEVAVLGLMPESFRSCGDSHDWDGAQRNWSGIFSH